MFFLLLLLDDRRIRILNRIQIREVKKHIDPTYPDPEHWYQAQTTLQTGTAAKFLVPDGGILSTLAKGPKRNGFAII
jgi:hypothetical protein